MRLSFVVCCRSTRLRLVDLQHFDNVMTNFIINKRTDVNLLISTWQTLAIDYFLVGENLGVSVKGIFSLIIKLVSSI